MTEDPDIIIKETYKLLMMKGSILHKAEHSRQEAKVKELVSNYMFKNHLAEYIHT
jgi:hypothetical protein